MTRNITAIGLLSSIIVYYGLMAALINSVSIRSNSNATSMMQGLTMIFLFIMGLLITVLWNISLSSSGMLMEIFYGVNNISSVLFFLLGTILLTQVTFVSKGTSAGWTM